MSMHKVIYKPDSQSTGEYTLVVNPDEYKRYKKGDTSIPLALVVQTFDVFHSSQGAQGKLGRPSKQQLDNDFGTSKDEEVVKIVLEKGTYQATGGIAGSGDNNDRNTSRGASVDTRGSGVRGKLAS